MMLSGCPKGLWDECLTRESYVRYKTALDIFGLEGQVPKSRAKYKTVYISTIAEYGWYEWVKYRDTAASFPVSKIKLGRDLGAAIDIAPPHVAQYIESKWSSSVTDLCQVPHT
jgi:hypothetical protein